MSNGNTQPSFSLGGFFGTIIWGFALGIGFRFGWGIVGLIIDVLAKAAGSSNAPIVR